MKTIIKHFTRFKQPDENGETRCSVIIDGEYIFSSDEAKKLGSKLTEDYAMKKIYYSDEEDFQQALRIMPDYECCDSERKVLVKTI